MKRIYKHKKEYNLYRKKALSFAKVERLYRF